MLDAGVHFGHQVRRWHPKMEPYIFGVKRNIHIIDLEETEKLLKTASEFLYETAKQGKPIIFVGTKKQAREIIELEAKRSGAMYITERWVGGTITNFKTIKKNLDKYIGLMKGREEGSFSNYTKKERLLIDRDIERMTMFYGGIVNMKDLPAVVVAIDPKREKTAVQEAKSHKIPVVAIVDTNADPRGIDYIIPGNDDAIRSLAILVKALADAVEEGYKDYAKEKEANAVIKPVEVKPVVKTEEKVEVKEVKKEEKAEKTEKKAKEEPAKQEEAHKTAKKASKKG